MGLPGLKSRCLHSCVPSGGPRGECVLCLQCLEATCVPWLVAPSIFRASSCIALTCASSLVSSPLILTLLAAF